MEWKQKLKQRLAKDLKSFGYRIRWRFGPGTPRTESYSVIAASTVLSLTLYIAVLFTQSDFFSSRSPQLLDVLLAGLAFPFILNKTHDLFLKKQRMIAWAMYVLGRNAYIVLLCELARRLLKGERKHLEDIFWGRNASNCNGGIEYLLLTAAMFFILYRLNRWTQKMSNSLGSRQKVEAQAAVTGILILIYFSTVTAFAVRVYPFIPASKGGGDYSHAPISRITLKAPLFWPTEKDSLRKKIEDYNDWVVLEELGATVYVARRSDIISVGGNLPWIRKIRFQLQVYQKTWLRE